jgi:hypothetical protein
VEHVVIREANIIELDAAERLMFSNACSRKHVSNANPEPPSLNEVVRSAIELTIHIQ